MKQENNTPRAETKKQNQIKRTALTGLLFALAVILSLVESLVPVPAPVGVRLGLSNIVVMYSLFFLRGRDALIIAILKSFFVMMTRGTVAGLLSLSGGLFSLGIMMLLLFVFRERVSFLIIGVSGALFHNFGQILAASVVLGSVLWYYLPILIFSGLIAGIVTSFLLKVSIPALKKLQLTI
ncbi:MAG: Gx transporter family protein [Clostridiales bacterium]|jgi:heptaprenyl diphosphate synthase|nr:Gx transporter family protein [Clostridiales bacterium]